MPRNRYTPTVRERERAQIARQEKELEALTRDLVRVSEDLLLPVSNEEKARRQVRLEHDKRHKLAHFRAAPSQQSS